MSLVDVGSIEELRRLGAKLETSKEAVQKFVPPSRKLGVLEPDLAYVDVYSSVDSCEDSTPVQSNSSKTDRKQVGTRCKSIGVASLPVTLKGNSR